MKQSAFLSCLIFVLFLILLPTHPAAMFGDPDSWWHLAAGDLILKTDAVPPHDSWSFTASNTRWFNISWAWDALASYLHHHFGWQGLIAMNSIMIAATLALIFASCLTRSKHGIAAFITTLLLSATMIATNLRSYQVTFLLTALLSLLLPQIVNHRRSSRWLLVIPPLMVVWVNGHGGFLVAFFLLGAYGAEALWRREWPLVAWFAATGLASMAACLINPYGIDIITAVLRVLDSGSRSFIGEWQAMDFSHIHGNTLYIVLFLVLVMMRPGATAVSAERWIAYVWLALGISTIRHLEIFAIVSAPLFSQGLRDVMIRRAGQTPPLFAQRLAALCWRLAGHPASVCALLIMCTGLSLWTFTPQAVRLYGTKALAPPSFLAEEIAFLETHYPHVRLLNDYNLGGQLIFYARGRIPVFVDGRVETAYPAQVMLDYAAFLRGDKGWETMFDRYRIGGAIFLSSNRMLIDRFIERRGWHLAFTGKTATIFIRDKVK